MRITCEICATEKDYVAALGLWKQNWTDNGYPPPDESLFRRRYKAQELCVAKDRDADDGIVGFYQFHVAHEIEPGLATYIIVYVSEPFRSQGVAAKMRAFTRSVMKERGVDHLMAYAFQREDMRGLAASGAIGLDRVEVINGITYDVWRGPI